MSTICGAVSVDNNSVNESIIRKMCRPLAGRRPDNEGVYFKRLGQISAGLGSSTQPVPNENQDVWVIMDGSIYNYAHLRKELEQMGHRFRTKSKAECIVHAYEAYGEDCVRRLQGEFALAIWDERQATFLLARDRLGTKPLLYMYENSRFVFSSDFNSILANSGIKKGINLPAVHHYLSYSYVPAPFTAFKGIYKLLPAHKLLFRKGKISIERYWDLDFSDSIKVTEQEAREKLIELLAGAIKKRLDCQGSVGAFLSGGIDSSAVVAIMSKVMGRSVKTFSIGFPVEQYDEIAYARKISKFFNTEHYEYIVKPQDLKIIPELVRYYGEPFADSSSLPSYYLARLASQHVRTVLSGDGGDELFAGYERHWANRWAENYQKLPGLLKEYMIPWLVRHLPEFKDPKNSLGRAKRFLQAAALPCAQRYLYWTGIFNPELKEQLYSAEFKKEVSNFDSTQFMREAFERSNFSNVVHSSMYVDTMLHLHNDSNVKVDVVSRANSLEVRAPFMDDRLFDFVSKLPSRFKLRGRTSKYILKKTIANSVPNQNIYRKKMGFAIPIHRWFRKEAKGILCDTLLSQGCLKRGYFRPKVIRHLVEEHISGRRNYSPQLWTLLMLELWHRNFIDGN